MKALIFDVDGTLAETEELHRLAFNAAFAAHGLSWEWSPERYKDLLKVSGGKERMRAFIEEDGITTAEPPDALVRRLHLAKTELYAGAVREGRLALRPGVADLIDEGKRRGLRLAIATTTSRENVDALLAVAFGRPADFEVIGCGDMVPNKKPAPDVYQLVLERLCLPAAECLAFEDSFNGLQAAKAAGLRCVVTPSLYCGDDDFTGADVIVADLTARDAVLRLM